MPPRAAPARDSHAQTEDYFEREDGHVVVETVAGRTRLEDLSVGYKSVIAMASDIMQELMVHYDNLEYASATVLIDEIEKSAPSSAMEDADHLAPYAVHSRCAVRHHTLTRCAYAACTMAKYSCCSAANTHTIEQLVNLTLHPRHASGANPDVRILRAELSGLAVRLSRPAITLQPGSTSPPKSNSACQTNCRPAAVT